MIVVIRSESARAFIRGGNWNNGSNAGVLTLNLNNSPSNTNTNIGFRVSRYTTRVGKYIPFGVICKDYGSCVGAVIVSGRISSLVLATRMGRIMPRPHGSVTCGLNYKILL